MEHAVTLDDRPVPSHLCTICGAMWRYLTPKEFGTADSWTLISPFCGACCDMAPMGEQIQLLTIGEFKEWLDECERFSNCICYACATAGHNGGDEQCACDGIPVFDAARCGSCKHKAACDVALHPELYPDATREPQTT